MIRRRRNLIGLVLLLLPLVPIACQSGSLPPPSNADVARTSLNLALESWKKKEPAEAVTKLSPPIFFNDPKRNSVLALEDFRVDSEFEKSGQSIRIGVMLKLVAPDGSAKERKATYLIDTGASVVIVPD